MAAKDGVDGRGLGDGHCLCGGFGHCDYPDGRCLSVAFPTREAIKALFATLIVCGLLKALPFPGTMFGLVGMTLLGIGLYGALAFIFDIGELRTRFGPVVRTTLASRKSWPTGQARS